MFGPPKALASALLSVPGHQLHGQRCKSQPDYGRDSDAPSRAKGPSGGGRGRRARALPVLFVATKLVHPVSVRFLPVATLASAEVFATADGFAWRSRSGWRVLPLSGFGSTTALVVAGMNSLIQGAVVSTTLGEDRFP